MLDALKFVQKGVAKREIVPGTSYFRIHNKRITGTNGNLSFSAPIECPFAFAPHAHRFVKDLLACEGEVKLSLLPNGSVGITSGDFQAAVPCIPVSDVPSIVPEGKKVKVSVPLLAAFRALFPFIGTDDFRPWSTGVLFSGASAFATNNVVIVEYWLGSNFPHVVNVPSVAINEVLSIDEELDYLQIADGSITFHYPDGRWIKSALLALNWPHVLDLFEKAWTNNLTPIPKDLASNCLRLSKLTDRRTGKIYFRGSDISLEKTGLTQTGELIRMQGVPETGCYFTQYLNDVLSVATVADFSTYPKAVPFAGNNFRGVMLGTTIE